jgi:hypothetical protein
VVTSNHLRTEFHLVERLERAMRSGSHGRRMAVIAAVSVAIAFLAVMPMLYFLTFTDRSLLQQ